MIDFCWSSSCIDALTNSSFINEFHKRLQQSDLFFGIFNARRTNFPPFINDYRPICLTLTSFFQSRNINSGFSTCSGSECGKAIFKCCVINPVGNFCSLLVIPFRYPSLTKPDSLNALRPVQIPVLRFSPSISRPIQLLVEHLFYSPQIFASFQMQNWNYLLIFVNVCFTM